MTLFAFCVSIGLADARAQSSFYWPKRGTPTPPRSDTYSVEPVAINSGSVKLSGWVLEPKNTEPVGTVVFCHGNGGNMQHHVGFIDFLPRHAFRVLMFDYQGYGNSTPTKPSRATTVADVHSAIDYATDRWGKVWLMGQSLGAALSLDVAAERRGDIQGVIAVAPFTSYGAIARKVLRGRLVSRPLAIPSYLIVRGGHDPIDAVAKISPTPLLLVHGENDELIPPRMSQELYDRARSPKEFLLVPGAGHNSGWEEMGEDYVDSVVRFLRGGIRAPGY